jgi:hypothetical protein
MDTHVTEIVELRREMRAGFARIEERFAKLDDRFAKQDERFAKQDERFASVDGRIDDAMLARMEQVIKNGLGEQTRFFFLAWSVILAAIIGLYARP